MCFVKTSTPKIPKETIQEDIVKIHEADEKNPLKYDVTMKTTDRTLLGEK